AIRKTELTKRFFMTGFLKQFHPDGVNAFAASNFGTRVVTFRVQNDKLYMLDASDIKATSDAFDPTLVLEAWPIVHDNDQFNRDRNANKFVLVDPSAGLNRFSVFAESFNVSPPFFHVELSFLQDFRKIADGVTFDQVFTGETTDPIHDASGGEINALRLSGT